MSEASHIRAGQDLVYDWNSKVRLKLDKDPNMQKLVICKHKPVMTSNPSWIPSSLAYIRQSMGKG